MLGNFQITNAKKPKIIISTDIGGSDPDDFQSMVHLLVYADRFEILGLISSPPHDSRVGHILEATDAYEKDIKMGDTPSVLYLLHGDPKNPESESWGGSYAQTEHCPNYWTDNLDTSLQENNKPCAKTVNRWRKEFLDDWARRMEWLK